MFLRATYKKNFNKPPGWPLVKNKNWKFVDLAIVNSDDNVTRLTVDVNSKDKLIKLHELFDCTTNSSARILIKGAPHPDHELQIPHTAATKRKWCSKLKL